MKRDLLFFAKIKEMKNTYKDEPIYRYIFVDLRTDVLIGLPVSKYSSELSDIYNRRYYSNIDEIKEDYDILCLEDDNLNQVTSYVDVKQRFLTLSREKIPYEEINQIMMEEFNTRVKQLVV